MEEDERQVLEQQSQPLATKKQNRVHYERNYVDSNFLSRMFLWSFNTLINSVNQNDGKMQEKFIEDMRLDEDEDEEQV